jgi:hypothetical protein
VTSIETDHIGTVYLTGWYTQSLKIGDQLVEAQEGENAFLASIKTFGKEISVKKFSQPGICRYYSSTIGKDSLLYVLGITSDVKDSISETHSDLYNNLIVSTFENGEIRDTSSILLQGVDLIPVSIREAGDRLWIAARFKYNCINGTDTIHAKGQNDVLLLTYSPDTKEKSAWAIGGNADDLPLNLTVSGKQVMISGSYSDILRAGDEELVANEMGCDLFLISYEAESQKQLTAFSIGGINNDFPCAASTSQAGLYIVGQYKESLKIGFDSIKTKGSYDVFIARYENCGAKNAINIATKAKNYLNGEITYELKAEDGYKMYRWDNHMGFGQSVEAKAGNSYVVEALDSYGCTCHGEISLSKNKSAVIPETIDPEKQTSPFKLYPTITQDKVYWQAGSEFPVDGATLRVFNTTGQVVLKRNYSGEIGANSVQSIDLNNKVQGVYMIEISGHGYFQKEKVIVN